jgi:hypothetical protein
VSCNATRAFFGFGHLSPAITPWPFARSCSPVSKFASVEIGLYPVNYDGYVRLGLTSSGIQPPKLLPVPKNNIYPTSD